MVGRNVPAIHLDGNAVRRDERANLCCSAARVSYPIPSSRRISSAKTIISSVPLSEDAVVVCPLCFPDCAVCLAVLTTSCPVCLTFWADCCARSLKALPVPCTLVAACCAAPFKVFAVCERPAATCCPACCNCSFSGRLLRSCS